MRYADPNILEDSRHYFVQSSAFAREHLLYADSVGHFHVGSQYRVDRMDYDSYLLMAVVAGTIICRSRGQSVTLQPGSVLLLDCTQPHSYFAAEPAEIYFVHINGSMIEPLYRCFYQSFGLAASTDRLDLFVQTIAGMIDQIGEHGLLRETQASSQLYALLMLLAESARTGAVAEKELAAIEDIQRYILRHLEEKLTIEHLAERLGYSASHFSRLFRQAAGQSPYQFITRARIDRARHLLSTSRLSVQEIAEGCGFPNLSNFCHAFREACGMTPGAFRKQPI